MHQLKVEATLSRLRWVCFHLAISRVGSIPTHPVLLSGWPSVGAILKRRDDSGSLTDGCREPGLCGNHAGWVPADPWFVSTNPLKGELQATGQTDR